MKRLLLMFSLTCAIVLTYAQVNDYYAFGENFDDLEVGYTFPVVTSKGKLIIGAKAVVELDADNIDNKVLHVTTADTAGFVNLPTPNNLVAANLNKKYRIINLSIKSNVAYDVNAECQFNLYYGNQYAYKGNTSKPVVFESGVWTNCSYSSLNLEKKNLAKEMQLGLTVTNADYYIDNICFLSTADAFERERKAIEKAKQDSIFKAELLKRDSTFNALKEEFARVSADLDNNMDKLVSNTFEQYEIGTLFSVYPMNGNTPIEGAMAVIEADPKNSNNKVLHVITNGEIGYVELDNPILAGDTKPASAANVLKATKEMSVNILINDASMSGVEFDVIWQGYYAHKTAPKKALVINKWINNTLALNLERNSLSKAMRIGLRSNSADYYIDDIVFILSSYNMDKPETTVRYWADKIDKNFGTCVNPGISTNDTFGKTVAKNFNAVVLENAMKFDATEPSRGGFNWQADGVVNFAIQNNMKVRGHTLTWHGQNPDWVSNAINAKSGTAKREEAIKILKNHIYNVVGHWKGKIAEWDVVNECLEENQGRAVGAGYATRTWSVWYTGFGGEDYIDSAFVWAHQADPDAKLYINDYNIGHWGGGHYENGKTHAMYNLAKRLKDAGIPIDGVGMQMHTSVTGLQPEQIEETVKQFRAIGLNCIITEMDMPGGQMNDKTVVRSISNEELAIQAQKYAQIADIMAKYDNAPTFMVWGVRDNQSWLDGSEATKPLLFFADLSPHQAYIDVRKTYQKWATVITGVEPITMDDEFEDDMTWYNPTQKSLDVFDIVGRKIASGLEVHQVEEFLSELPDGLYIVGGKKYMVKH